MKTLLVFTITFLAFTSGAEKTQLKKEKRNLLIFDSGNHFITGSEFPQPAFPFESASGSISHDFETGFDSADLNLGSLRSNIGSFPSSIGSFPSNVASFPSNIGSLSSSGGSFGFNSLGISGSSLLPSPAVPSYSFGIPTNSYNLPYHSYGVPFARHYGNYGYGQLGNGWNYGSGFIASIPRIRTINQHVAVPVPQPVPVTVTKTIPVPTPLKVTVPKPYAVPVQVKVPVSIPKPYEVKVDRKVPVPVTVKVPIEIPKPYPVYKTKKVKIEVEKPVFVKEPVEIKVPIPKPYPVEIPTGVQVKVPYPVVVKVPQFGEQWSGIGSFENIGNTFPAQTLSSFGGSFGDLSSLYGIEDFSGLYGINDIYGVNGIYGTNNIFGINGIYGNPIGGTFDSSIFEISTNPPQINFEHHETSTSPGVVDHENESVSVEARSGDLKSTEKPIYSTTSKPLGESRSEESPHLDQFSEKEDKDEIPLIENNSISSSTTGKSID
ncbi:uncharacterized protein [Leptinotarsa decemlineata]|uniref:uncharacterized protein n=1 Tax=Leptinotarsa decemlineata TaxID=7539 RepID=UPI003D309097